ncbi:MAG: ABC transporter ATP-binding protein, partial [Acidimicrobiales bacterium]
WGTARRWCSMPAESLVGLEPRPGVAKPDPLLVIDGVTRRFGGLAAVDVAHLEIPRHAITALIGPNGAGKTTFFNLLTGFDTPNEGEWSFDGIPLRGMPAHKVAAHGMVRTFQLTKALTRLSVMENMLLGAVDHPGERISRALFPRRWRPVEATVETRADAMLDRFNLAHMRDEYAGTLSGGQRRLLEMARAMMGDPALLMLDEPMAGVNPALVQSLLGHITGLRDEGTTVVFVEHDMDVVMEISDWVVVLAQGSVIAEGPPASIVSNRQVIDAYLGDPTEDD